MAGSPISTLSVAVQVDISAAQTNLAALTGLLNDAATSAGLATAAIDAFAASAAAAAPGVATLATASAGLSAAATAATPSVAAVGTAAATSGTAATAAAGDFGILKVAMGSLGTFALIGGLVSVGKGMADLASEGRTLTASLDEQRRQLGILFGDVDRGNQTMATASQFASAYGFTQKDVSAAVGTAAEAIKNSAVPLQQQLEIMGRLATLRPGETIQQAAQAIAGLAAGGRSVQEIARELGLTVDQATLLRDKVKLGEDAFRALDAVEKTQGATLQTLTNRMQGYEGVVRANAQAHERLAIAMGNLTSGAGQAWLTQQTALMRGFAALTDGGKAEVAQLGEQRQALAIGATSYADYTTRVQAYAAANGLAVNASVLFTQAEYDKFQASMVATQAVRDHEAATQAHTAATNTNAVAVAAAAEQLRIQKLSAQELVQATDLLSSALGMNSAALDVQVQKANLTAIQHEILKNAEDDANVAASAAIGSYLAAGGAMTTMGLKALAASGAVRDLNLALGLAEAKHDAGLTGGGGGAANKAALLAGGYDPTAAGAKQAVSDAGNSQQAAANQSQAAAAAAQFASAIAAANGAQQKVNDAGKTKAQLLAEARQVLAQTVRGTLANVEAQTAVNDAEAALINEQAHAGKKKGGSGSALASAQDAAAVAGQSHEARLAYWQGQLAADKKGSAEYFRDLAHIRTEQAAIDKGTGGGAGGLASAQDAAAVAGQSHEARLAYWQGQLAADKKGSAEYFRDLAHIKTEEAAIAKGSGANNGLAQAEQTDALAGLDAAAKLRYWEKQRAADEQGSKAWFEADAHIKDLQKQLSDQAKQDATKDAQDAASLADAKRNAAEAGKSHADVLAIEAQYLSTLTQNTKAYFDELTKVENLEKSVADDRAKARQAEVDASLARVHDAQDRMKEAREAQTAQNVLNDPNASAEMKQAASLKLQEIGLDQKKRGMDIARLDADTKLGLAAGDTGNPNNPRSAPMDADQLARAHGAAPAAATAATRTSDAMVGIAQDVSKYTAFLASPQANAGKPININIMADLGNGLFLSGTAQTVVGQQDNAITQLRVALAQTGRTGTGVNG